MARKQSIKQKLSKFVSLVKNNPEESFNNLQKIAKQKGYSFRRQDMQEARRLTLEHKGDYQEVKKNHSRIKREEKQKKIEAGKKQKKIEVKTKTEDFGQHYTRLETPQYDVRKPQDEEEHALEASIKALTHARRYLKRKEKETDRKPGLDFITSQMTLYGYVQIYDDTPEGLRQDPAGLVYDGWVNSSSYPAEFQKTNQDFFNSFLGNVKKIAQSLQGSIYYRTMKVSLVYWTEEAD